MNYHDATIRYGSVGVAIREKRNELERQAIVRYQRARVNCKCSICVEWKETPVGQQSVLEVALS